MTPLAQRGDILRLPSSPPHPGTPKSRLDLAVQRQITPLSKPTTSALRSSVIIPTFPSILRELIHNAVDAQATRIDVWVSDAGTSYTSIRVEDDGVGIAKEEMRAVGKRGRSGKQVSQTGLGGEGSYGFRGEALASIGALAMLEITSKTIESDTTYMKMIKNGETVYLGKAARPLGSDHGTTIVVKDLFDKIPVRQRTLNASGSSIIGSCRKVVEILALVQPQIKWTLFEDSNVGTSDGRSRKIMSVQGCRTSADVFRTIYGNAGVERVQKIRVSSGDRRIDGFISLGSAVTKAHQHLYVNGYPLDRCDLHQALTKRFAQSRFSAMTADDTVEYDRHPTRRSPRRLERHPVYVLNVSLPFEQIDNAYGPAKTVMGYQDSNSVYALILAVVDEFLKRHDFTSIKLPHAVPPARPPSLSPSKASRRHAPSLAGDISTPARQTPIPSGTPLNDRMDRLFTPLPCTPCDANCPSLPLRPTKRHKGVDEGVVADSSPRVVSKEWLDNVIRDTDMDVYGYSTPTELRQRIGKAFQHPAINDAKRSKMDFEVLDHITFSNESLRSSHVLGQIDRKFIACSLIGTSAHESSKPATNHRVLVLIDQHAADERASLEPLLEGLCDGFLSNQSNMKELKSPVHVILTREEMRTLTQPGVADILGRWGIRFELPSVDSEGVDFSQIAITHISSALETRLGRKEAVEMTRLFRDYLPFLDEHLPEIEPTLGTEHPMRDDSSRALEEAGTVGWEKAMRWVPKEMLELANSKACRNAIMFQDVLDLDQCQRLVHRLSLTKHPFICAHGRPSLVPITILGAPVPQTRRSIDWAAWAELLGA